VIGGFAKVEAALGHGEVEALIHAEGAAEDGKRKLMQAFRRTREDETGEIDVISMFSGTELDLALNRPNVVHAALLAGPGSETFLARVKRLQRFRTGNLPDDTNATAPADGANELSAPTDGAQGNSTE
jgi:hypothetical protein